MPGKYYNGTSFLLIVPRRGPHLKKKLILFEMKKRGKRRAVTFWGVRKGGWTILGVSENGGKYFFSNVKFGGYAFF